MYVEMQTTDTITKRARQILHMYTSYNTLHTISTHYFCYYYVYYAANCITIKVRASK